MSEINLLKDELRETKLGLNRRNLISLYVAAGIFVLELVLFGVLTLRERSYQKQARAVEQSGAGIDLEITKTEKERLGAISFQSRLANLEVLLQEHVYWSEVLEEIAAYTYKPIVYRTLQVDQGKHKVILTGTAPTYSDLGKLILGLRSSPKFLEVNFASSGQAEGRESGYGFQLEAVFDQKILLK